MTTKLEKSAKLLNGKKVGNWTVGKYKNQGSTAFICEAFNSENKRFAIKIFDNDILKKEELEERLRRQESLKGLKHPNIIQVHDVGFCNENSVHYLVMDYIDSGDLSQLLKSVPDANIPSIIKSVANAAKFLFDNKIVHRDIKPSNIALSRDLKTPTLLDLGVIKNIDFNDSSYTDHKKLNLVATKRYCSPEYLIRKESDNLETAMLALTFYQLGAVLHDLIMKKAIFSEHTLEPRLINAIQHEVPEIVNPVIPSNLKALAIRCLNKDPSTRLRQVDWKDFENIDQPNSSSSYINSEFILSMNCCKSISNKTIYKMLDNFLNIVEQVCKSKNFPRKRLQKEQNKHNKIAIKISFPPSNKDNLSAYVNTNFEVSIIDPIQQLITIHISSLFTNNENHFSDPVKLIFSNLYTTDYISKCLSEYLSEIFSSSIGRQYTVPEQIDKNI